MLKMSDNVDEIVSEGCENCLKLQQDLEKCQADQILNFRTLKQKIISTDMLIKKYSLKCQDYEFQSRKLEECTALLEKVQRECADYEIQLSQLLNETNELKKIKSDYETDKKALEEQLRSTNDSLHAAQVMCEQYKTKLEGKDAEYRKLVEDKGKAQESLTHIRQISTRHESTIERLKAELDQRRKDEKQTIKLNKRLQKKNAKLQRRLERLLLTKASSTTKRRQRRTSASQLFSSSQGELHSSDEEAMKIEKSLLKNEDEDEEELLNFKFSFLCSKFPLPLSPLPPSPAPVREHVSASKTSPNEIGAVSIDEQLLLDNSMETDSKTDMENHEQRTSILDGSGGKLESIASTSVMLTKERYFVNQTNTGGLPAMEFQTTNKDIEESETIGTTKEVSNNLNSAAAGSISTADSEEDAEQKKPMSVKFPSLAASFVRASDAIRPFELPLNNDGSETCSMSPNSIDDHAAQSEDNFQQESSSERKALQLEDNICENLATNNEVETSKCSLVQDNGVVHENQKHSAIDIKNIGENIDDKTCISARSLADNCDDDSKESSKTKCSSQKDRTVNYQTGADVPTLFSLCSSSAIRETPSPSSDIIVMKKRHRAQPIRSDSEESDSDVLYTKPSKLTKKSTEKCENSNDENMAAENHQVNEHVKQCQRTSRRLTSLGFAITPKESSELKQMKANNFQNECEEKSSVVKRSSADLSNNADTAKVSFITDNGSRRMTRSRSAEEQLIMAANEFLSKDKKQQSSVTKCSLEKRKTVLEREPVPKRKRGRSRKIHPQNDGTLAATKSVKSVDNEPGECIPYINKINVNEQQQSEVADQKQHNVDVEDLNVPCDKNISNNSKGNKILPIENEKQKPECQRKRYHLRSSSSNFEVSKKSVPVRCRRRSFDGALPINNSTTRCLAKHLLKVKRESVNVTPVIFESGASDENNLRVNTENVNAVPVIIERATSDENHADQSCLEVRKVDFRVDSPELDSDLFKCKSEGTASQESVTDVVALTSEQHELLSEILSKESDLPSLSVSPVTRAASMLSKKFKLEPISPLPPSPCEKRELPELSIICPSPSNSNNSLDASPVNTESLIPCKFDVAVPQSAVNVEPTKLSSGDPALLTSPTGTASLSPTSKDMSHAPSAFTRSSSAHCVDIQPRGDKISEVDGTDTVSEKSKISRHLAVVSAFDTTKGLSLFHTCNVESPSVSNKFSTASSLNTNDQNITNVECAVNENDHSHELMESYTDGYALRKKRIAHVPVSKSVDASSSSALLAAEKLAKSTLCARNDLNSELQTVKLALNNSLKPTSKLQETIEPKVLPDGLGGDVAKSAASVRNKNNAKFALPVEPDAQALTNTNCAANKAKRNQKPRKKRKASQGADSSSKQDGVTSPGRRARRNPPSRMPYVDLDDCGSDDNPWVVHCEEKNIFMESTVRYLINHAPTTVDGAEEVAGRFLCVGRLENVDLLIQCLLMQLMENFEDFTPDIIEACSGESSPSTPLLRDGETKVSYFIWLLSKKRKSLKIMEKFLKAVVKTMYNIRAKYRIVRSAQMLCRVYVAICRLDGNVERARVLCYDLLSRKVVGICNLLASIVAVWPAVFQTHHKQGHSYFAQVTEHVLLNKLQMPENLQNVFAKLSDWKISRSTSKALATSMIHELQGLEPKELLVKSSNIELSTTSFEVVKSMEILSLYETWVWTNDCVIRNLLWPCLQHWSHKAKQSKETTTKSHLHCDELIVVVFKLIGVLGLCCPPESNGSAIQLLTILKSILSELEKDKEAVPWIVQLSVIEASLHLAPFDAHQAATICIMWNKLHNNVLPPPLLAQMRHFWLMYKEKIPYVSERSILPPHIFDKRSMWSWDHMEQDT